MSRFRLDPFPQFTEKVLSSLLNARILLFSIVIAKITLDRLYRYATIINPLGYDEEGEPTLDILEYKDLSSVNDVFYTLNGYGAKGRQAYLTYLFYDVLFVLSRSAPIMVICAWSFKRMSEKFRPGIWIPLLNVALDLFESLVLFLLLQLFPQRIQALEQLAIWVIRAKKLSFYSTLALVFFSFVVGIYFGFHGLLADSVVMEKDRQEKARAREEVQDVLRKSAARRALAENASRAQSIKKKNT